jgi:2-methylisocitrate lyase-like PEP mutase family enzyme
MIAAVVEAPVNADFEGGFAIEARQVAANVKQAAITGIAGLSIEDRSGDHAEPLHDFELSVARVTAVGEPVGVRRTPRVRSTIARGSRSVRSDP